VNFESSDYEALARRVLCGRKDSEKFGWTLDKTRLCSNAARHRLTARDIFHTERDMGKTNLKERSFLIVRISCRYSTQVGTRKTGNIAEHHLRNYFRLCKKEAASGDEVY
jgi:hypothetical protein